MPFFCVSCQIIGFVGVIADVRQILCWLLTWTECKGFFRRSRMKWWSDPWSFSLVFRSLNKSSWDLLSARRWNPDNTEGKQNTKRTRLKGTEELLMRKGERWVLKEASEDQRQEQEVLIMTETKQNKLKQKLHTDLSPPCLPVSEQSNSRFIRNIIVQETQLWVFMWLRVQSGRGGPVRKCGPIRQKWFEPERRKLCRVDPVRQKLSGSEKVDLKWFRSDGGGLIQKKESRETEVIWVK